MHCYCLCTQANERHFFGPLSRKGEKSIEVNYVFLDNKYSVLRSDHGDAVVAGQLVTQCQHCCWNLFGKQGRSSASLLELSLVIHAV